MKTVCTFWAFMVCLWIGVYALIAAAAGDSKSDRQTERRNEGWNLPANALAGLRNGQDGQRSAQQDEPYRSHGWGG